MFTVTLFLEYGLRESWDLSGETDKYIIYMKL